MSDNILRIIKKHYLKLKKILYSPFESFEELLVDTNCKTLEDFIQRFKYLEKQYFKYSLFNQDFILRKAKDYLKCDNTCSDVMHQSKCNHIKKKKCKEKRQKKPLGHFRQFSPTIIYFSMPFIIFSILNYLIVVANYEKFFFLNLDNITFSNILYNVLMFTIIYYFIKFTIKAILCLFDCLKCLKHEKEVATERGLMYGGGLGVGKTLSMVFDSYIVAKNNFAKIEKEYYYNRTKYYKKEFKNFEEYCRYKIIEESYYFYVKSNAIPCLFSSVPVLERFTNKYSFKCSIDNFLQNTKFLESAVACMDESGQSFTTQMSYNNKLKEALDDYLSLGRQINDIYIKCTEQDFEDNMITLRRIIQINRLLLSLNKVREPKLLLKLKDYIYKRALKRIYKLNKFDIKNNVLYDTYNLSDKKKSEKDLDFVVSRNKTEKLCKLDNIRKILYNEPFLTNREYKYITLLNKLCSKIGFLKIVYVDKGCTEQGNNIKKGKRDKIKSYNICKYTPFIYDSRAYQFKYKLNNDLFKVEMFDNQMLDGEQEIKYN